VRHYWKAAAGHSKDRERHLGLSMRKLMATCLLGAAAMLPAHRDAQAQSVADFYRGRMMSMIIGYSAGGGYDIYARTLARHMGRHIPGNPTIVAQNMPGAGSLKAANYIYAVAPKDGSVLGIFGRGLAMEPLVGSGASFDARKFGWIGSGSDQVSVCATWHTSAIKNWNDMLTTPFTVAGEGSGSDPDLFSIALKNMFGIKLRVISGYPGANEMSLALERGEVDGRCGWSWSSIKLAKPDWLTGGKLNLIVQMALAKSPDLPGVPFIMDYATTREQQQILRLILSRQAMGWPFVTTPGLPEERLQALRKAFDETMADPEFLGDAKAHKLDVNPMGGDAVAALVDELYRTPPDLVAQARKVIVDQPR
jgi:tripartite-type tricarboxylate transporter receptor subunit TctC